MTKFTFFAKLKKELNIINWVFCSQFQRKTFDLDTPTLHQDGRYCTSIFIRSNDELLAIEPYKMHYTERYERVLSHELLKTEIDQIIKDANRLVDYFNENLTVNNPKIVDFLNEDKGYKMVSLADKNAMIMLVENLDPQHILFGYSGNVANPETEWTNRKHNHFTTNRHLADKCVSLIEFLQQFNFPEPNEGKKPIDYISENKEKALELDLRQVNMKVHGILQDQILKLALADSKDEIDEVKTFSKRAYNECKEKLRNFFINENHRVNVKGNIAPFLVDLRLYLEYKKLYDSILSETDNSFLMIEKDEEIITLKDEVNIEIVSAQYESETDKELVSVIDEFFNDIEFIYKDGYEVLKDFLVRYLKTGKYPNNPKEIQFSAIDRKKLGWRFNSILKKFDKKIDADFLKFAVTYINRFKGMDLDENNYQKSNVYRAFKEKRQ
jgi:hypothetical protein